MLSQFEAFLNSFGLNSYVIIFLIMLVEGPIITALASYAASLGYFNIWVILLMSIFGNFIPDILFYSMGRFSRTKKIEFFLETYFLNGEGQVKKLENNLHAHFGKTFFIVKLCPMLPIPGLLLSGFIKIKFFRFLVYDLIFNLFYSIVFTLLGYSFGFAIDKFLKYFKIGQYSILGMLVLLIVVYIFIKFFKKNQRENYSVKLPSYRDLSLK